MWIDVNIYEPPLVEQPSHLDLSQPHFPTSTKRSWSKFWNFSLGKKGEGFELSATFENIIVVSCVLDLIYNLSTNSHSNRSKVVFMYIYLSTPKLKTFSELSPISKLMGNKRKRTTKNPSWKSFTKYFDTFTSSGTVSLHHNISKLILSENECN